MDTVNERLIGVSHASTLSTHRRTNPNFYGQTRGVFGRAQGFFYVIENQGRMQIHYHGLILAGLSHWLEQSAASGDLGTVIANVLSEQFTAHASPALHAAHLLRRQEQVRFRHSEYAPPTSPLLQPMVLLLLLLQYVHVERQLPLKLIFTIIVQLVRNHQLG